jgi:hypothetical protein
VSKPDDLRASRWQFAVAYLFWLGVFVSIIAAVWLSSSELSTFRYAGF